MKDTYILVAATVLILVGLSWTASGHLGASGLIPMQWGVNGHPSWYAPKWFALSFGPAIGCFAMASVLAARHYDPDCARAIRELLPLSAILISGHAFYLYMLWKQASSQPV